MIKIEKSIPIPQRRLERKPYKYPFSTMEVGDSFLVKEEDFGKATIAEIRSRMHQLKRSQMALGKKFITMAVDGGLRVWRTE